MKILKEDVIQAVTRKEILGRTSILEAEAFLQHMLLVKAQQCQASKAP